MLGGALAFFFGWRACYAFLLLLGLAVGYNMWHKLPETRPPMKEKPKMWASFRLLLTNRTFVPYLAMLICGLAGVAVFEASSGVLMRDGLGLGSMAVSILFILPIPAAFFGAWFAGRDSKSFSFLVWCAVICCLVAGALMWIPGLLGVMNVWTLLIPAALFFFGAGMLFPLATTAAMEPFPYLAGAAGALVGGLQNVGSGVATWISALMPQGGQGSVGLLMLAVSVIMVLCWLPLAHRLQNQQPMAS